MTQPLHENTDLPLGGMTYDELFMPEKLAALDARFIAWLKDADPSCAATLVAYRAHADIDSKSLSTLLIQSAEYLEVFISALFSIEAPVRDLSMETLADNPIFNFKQNIVQRVVKRALKTEITESFSWFSDYLMSCDADVFNGDSERNLAVMALDAFANKDADTEHFQHIINWCVRAISTDEGRAFTKGWVSFKQPKKIDFEALVPVEPCEHDACDALQSPAPNLRHRDGFSLTDEGMSRRDVMSEIHYCVYCHKNDGDFCSTGFPVKKKEPELGLKENPLGELLTGCPLDEKISEMHALKRDGFSIAALAMIMIDNPMCPATGHRICNDCMKACIYQKQEPVDIPQVETRVLKDVLTLPWGVEIYDLLTRWNPLRQTQSVIQAYNGKKVLVMGMGPAGFTLAHYLLMDGFAVVGADGLKIEPLDEAWIKNPIKSYADLCENLDDRVTAGFGGVAEYGITVRWDKNYLKLIYLTLMRRHHFQAIGNVRFGGTVTIEDAWDLGFDHLAIAVGAGLPRELPIENSLAPGMRQANDFLMALQLTGAAKEVSLANLQVRLPAVVIGGGLTGVDAATEVQAYYLKQIEKIAQRYHTLLKTQALTSLRAQFNTHDLGILDEFLEHAALVEAERALAVKEHRKPDFIKLIHRFGGVSIVYRKRMQDAPAYRKNYEELSKAMEEGLFYIEHASPTAVMLDDAGDSCAIKCTNTLSQNEQIIPARTILVATGAKPNVAYAFEHRDALERAGFEYKRFASVNNILEEVTEARHVKSKDVAMFTSYDKNDKRVSFLGDTHQTFHGSVVKAIASAKRAHLAIKPVLAEINAHDLNDYDGFNKMITYRFTAQLVSTQRLSDHVLEMIVHAPQAASKYLPGQFYRVQNFETGALKIHDTLLQSEGVALMAAPVAGAPERLSFLIFEHGTSTRLFHTFKPGTPLALMGPSGVHTKIPDTQETFMMIGGQMAIAHLRATGAAMKAAGMRVVLVATLESSDDIICRDTMDSVCDEIVWVVGDVDLSDALRAYGAKDSVLVPLSDVSRIMVVGGSALLCTVKNIRGHWLDAAVSSQALWYASVYGTMQCMLKGVCAQCLQWQIDPVTGKRTKAVYTCSWQDQPFEKIDIENIDQRLGQNRMQERLSDLWLSHILNDEKINES
jgi:NADPH-dependent glutamate synthase beta subunit-like oxidoreductase/NAD(P)H-flavin reductase